MFTRAISIAVAVGLLAGCASEGELSAARKSIRTVRLSEIPAPPPPTVMTGMGVLITLVELAANPAGATLSEQSAEARGARVAQTVRGEFVLHYSAIKAFPSLTQDKGDATLELEIKDYGLYPGASPYRPVMRAGVRVAGRLVLPGGKVLWSDSETGTAEGAFELFEYLESPAFTRERFRRAAELAVLKLLNDLDVSMGYEAADALAPRQDVAVQRIAAYEQAQQARLAAVFAAFAGPARLPRQGDSWSYRLTEPQQGGNPKRRDYVVKASAVSEKSIRDELALDGEAAGRVTHAGGLYLATQGVSVFSPYLPAFTQPSAAMAKGRLGFPDADASCNAPYACTAAAQFHGVDEVIVPAGTFEVIKLRVEHAWTPTQGMGGSTGYGSRMLTIYYSPKVKRAVKFTSATRSGLHPPITADFVLELQSYQEQ